MTDQTETSRPMHPEAEALLPHISGKVLEVGCGSSPTPGVTHTVDHNAGLVGGAGVEIGKTSLAGVRGDMGWLPFRDQSFDAVVSRHVLEHDPDTVGVLDEWVRVLRLGGTLAAVVPDQESYPGSTFDLDPTHRACFGAEQLEVLCERAGLSHISHRSVVPNWSFMVIGVRL